MAADASWAVVPAVVRGTSPQPLAERAEHALAQAEAPFEPREDVKRRFESAHSTEPEPIDASDIERWASRSRAALRHLSRGEYEAARRALLEARAISERAAEALNRETMRARQVLDTCLYAVRAALETGAAAEAERQARECRLLVPRMQPSAYTHTPEVRELVRAVDASFEAESTGELSVASTPGGCSVRVNGVYFGPTPLATSELPRGTYRVQVECDETMAGRVHRVVLGEQDTSLHVDVRAERALRTVNGVALEYDSEEALAQRSLRDAAAIARAVSTPVLLVRSSVAGVSLVPVTPEGVVREPIRVDDATSLGERATRALLTGDEDEPTARDARDGASIALLSTAGAAYAVASYLVTWRTDRADELRAMQRSDAGYLAAQDRYLRSGVALLGDAAAAGTLASVATGRLVRHARHPRGYAVGGGLVGLGFGTAATVLALRSPTCFGSGPCGARDRTADRVGLLGAFAMPGLAMPLALLFPRESDAVPTLTVSGDVAMLAVRGSLR